MQPLLKRYLHPAASDALRSINFPVERIGQTLGNAAASGGTHLSDGTVNNQPYCAATDFSVRGMDDTQVKELLAKLAGAGFAGFHRSPGHDHWPLTEKRHVHAIFAAVPMKPALQVQIHDWLNGRNGLMSHAAYTYWRADDAAQQSIRTLFLAHNPMHVPGE